MINDRRFWFNVQKTPSCWLWIGARCPKGYGSIRRRDRTTSTHRWVWEQIHGPIPKGMVICHKCDIPGCVNPDHLFLGTYKDNAQDMIKKGRAKHDNPPFGENHPHAKLTEVQVKEIRELYATGQYSLSKLAMKYGVCLQLISRIKQRKIWRHVV
jgi:hypothetical protein